MTIIIGLTGKAGSGKDTVAEMLDSKGFMCIALAAPIKAMIEALYHHAGASTHYTEHPHKEDPCANLQGLSYRQMAQALGTEWAQQALGRQHLWTGLAHDRIAELVGNGYTKFCITDIRFPHEVEWLKRLGGAVWRIDRPTAKAVNAHISEQYQIPADWVCRNHGTLDELACIVNARIEIESTVIQP